MSKQSKVATFSVRVEDNLAKRLDVVSSIVPINKSDFLRSCLEKLCDDNQMLIDHCPKINEYLHLIKKEMSRLPRDLVVVKNGSWTDVEESTIIFLCDQLWKSSKLVFDNWRKLIDSYDLETKGRITDFSKAVESGGLLDLESVVMLLAEKSKKLEHPDIPMLISKGSWIDDTEANKVSLAYACKKAFEEQTAEKVLKEALENAKLQKKEGPQQLVVDAKGIIRRSGSVLHLPVTIETIPVRIKR
jgi:hypothetical protein